MLLIIGECDHRKILYKKKEKNNSKEVVQGNLLEIFLKLSKITNTIEWERVKKLPKCF